MKKLCSFLFMAATVIALSSQGSTYRSTALANAQFQAVSNYALAQTHDQTRVLEIVKTKNSDFFVITYGDIDVDGNEVATAQKTVEARIAHDGDTDPGHCKVELVH